MNLTVFDDIQLLAFFLAFSRWLGIVLNMPIFDNTSVPVTAKILSAMLISYVFFPVVETVLTNEILSVGKDNIWLLTSFHVLTGLTIGYILKIIMGIFVSAGAIMTQQMGFSAVSYFDPTYAAKVGPIEKLIQWTLIIMIISSGGLLPIFKGALNSFHTLSFLNAAVWAKPAHFYYDFFKSLIVMALILSSPILFSNLLLNMVLGIVARTVPQMNILMVSFVVNIGIGLLVFVAISEEFFYVAYDAYVQKLGDWFRIIS